MSTASPDLFALAQQRLDWAAQRQSVLAQNIANAATPGYTPKDLPNFAQTLAQTGAQPLRQTQPNHLAGTLPTATIGAITPRPEVRSADGNAVRLDDQLTKVADTGTTQSLVTSIYHKYLGLFGLALGRGQ